METAVYKICIKNRSFFSCFLVNRNTTLEDGLIMVEVSVWIQAGMIH